MLGTAQFGQTYGVANRSGAPSFSEICAMLAEAAEAGVNSLDTAYGYGDSEKILGRALLETGLRDHFFIVTKTNNLLPPGLSGGEAEIQIRTSVEESLRRLQADRVDVVLLHRDTNPAYLSVLDRCRTAGLIGAAGVSVGSVSNAERFLPDPCLRAVQAPLNVLDRRFDHFVQAVHQRQGLVFARSCYLQGLLLMNDEATPPHLRPVQGDRAYFQKAAEELGVSLPELLLRAMLRRPEITSVVIGTENQLQLRENLRISHLPPLPETACRLLDGFSPTVPEWLVDPPQWASRI